MWHDGGGKAGTRQRYEAERKEARVFSGDFCQIKIFTVRQEYKKPDLKWREKQPLCCVWCPLKTSEFLGIAVLHIDAPIGHIPGWNINISVHESKQVWSEFTKATPLLNSMLFDDWLSTFHHLSWKWSQQYCYTHCYHSLQSGHCHSYDPDQYLFATVVVMPGLNNPLLCPPTILPFTTPLRMHLMLVAPLCLDFSQCCNSLTCCQDILSI